MDITLHGQEIIEEIRERQYIYSYKTMTIKCDCIKSMKKHKILKSKGYNK